MWSKQSIYRIPSSLRDLDPKAYEPRVVSIGPYHHGKEQLEPMEEHKHRALKHFLARCPNDHFDDILAKFSARLPLTLWVGEGMFYLPHLTIDETTRPTLLNLMAFERLHLHYEETHPVTDYVLLMASLIRKENDVEHLRKESILWCSPGWTNESVVKLFADLTRNVVFNETRRINPEIDALCKRPENRYSSEWRRFLNSDTKTRFVVLLTFYGVVISFVNTVFTIVNFFVERKHRSVVK